jgi:hypothetical protein
VNWLQDKYSRSQFGVVGAVVTRDVLLGFASGLGFRVLLSSSLCSASRRRDVNLLSGTIKGFVPDKKSAVRMYF